MSDGYCIPIPPQAMEAIRDVVDIAFDGADYIPESPEDAADLEIVSGSSRLKYSYDPAVDSVVHVIDFIGLISLDDQVIPDHRIVLFWDNGDEFEVELEEGILIADNNKEDIEKARVKILAGLAAVTEII
ncbi:MAG: hypothetical protein JWO47_362 [Candidatus Saccharibacteria bacterium]|nr:hypothetical protein [Candidatus Saccharibacteria bacterium]